MTCHPWTESCKSSWLGFERIKYFQALARRSFLQDREKGSCKSNFHVLARLWFGKISWFGKINWFGIIVTNPTNIDVKQKEQDTANNKCKILFMGERSLKKKQRRQDGLVMVTCQKRRLPVNFWSIYSLLNCFLEYQTFSISSLTSLSSSLKNVIIWRISFCSSFRNFFFNSNIETTIM